MEEQYAGKTLSEWADCFEKAYELFDQCDIPPEEMDFPAELSGNKQFWLGLCEAFGGGFTGDILKDFAAPELLSDEDFIDQMAEIDPDVMVGLDDEDEEYEDEEDDDI